MFKVIVPEKNASRYIFITKHLKGGEWWIRQEEQSEEMIPVQISQKLLKVKHWISIPSQKIAISKVKAKSAFPPSGFSASPSQIITIVII